MFGLDTFPCHDLNSVIGWSRYELSRIRLEAERTAFHVREIREIIVTLVRVKHTIAFNMHCAMQ